MRFNTRREGCFTRIGALANTAGAVERTECIGMRGSVSTMTSSIEPAYWKQ